MTYDVDDLVNFIHSDPEKRAPLPKDFSFQSLTSKAKKYAITDDFIILAKTYNPELEAHISRYLEQMGEYQKLQKAYDLGTRVKRDELLALYKEYQNDHNAFQRQLNYRYPWPNIIAKMPLEDLKLLLPYFSDDAKRAKFIEYCNNEFTCLETRYFLTREAMRLGVYFFLKPTQTYRVKEGNSLFQVTFHRFSYMQMFLGMMLERTGMNTEKIDVTLSAKPLSQIANLLKKQPDQLRAKERMQMHLDYGIKPLFAYYASWIKTPKKAFRHYLDGLNVSRQTTWSLVPSAIAVLFFIPVLYAISQRSLFTKTIDGFLGGGFWILNTALYTVTLGLAPLYQPLANVFDMVQFALRLLLVGSGYIATGITYIFAALVTCDAIINNIPSGTLLTVSKETIREFFRCLWEEHKPSLMITISSFLSGLVTGCDAYFRRHQELLPSTAIESACATMVAGGIFIVANDLKEWRDKIRQEPLLPLTQAHMPDPDATVVIIR